MLNDRPAAYRTLTRMASLAARLVPKQLGPLKEWTRYRELPQPARRTLHDLMEDRAGQ